MVPKRCQRGVMVFARSVAIEQPVYSFKAGKAGVKSQRFMIPCQQFKDWFVKGSYKHYL